VTFPGLAWQPSLFSSGEPADVDPSFASVERIALDGDSWVDHGPGWVRGAGRLYDEVVATRDWGQRERRMYDKVVTEPRLTSSWNLASGDALEPPILEGIRVLLGERYGREFDSVGFNLYRNGSDSVAWHADRIPKAIEAPIVVLVSLGEPRRFLLKPKEGGQSRAFFLGEGDLLVTGGNTQRTWLHSVPKVKRAGPRISVAYRHGFVAPPPGARAGRRALSPRAARP
jgi:alkylated DNA repair dioxygenase AlkB